MVGDCPSVEKNPSKPHSPITIDFNSGVTAAGTPLIWLYAVMIASAWASRTAVPKVAA